MKLYTRKELAAKLHVVQGTITKWEQAGLPVAKPGRRGTASLFKLAAVQEWRRDRDQAARQNGTVDLTRERARKERAQALVAEQTLAIRAGDLIPRVEVEETWTAEIAAVRSKLISWAATLSDRVYRAAELEGVAGVEKTIEAAVEELLGELSEGKHDRKRAKRKPKPKKKPAKKKTSSRTSRARTSSRKKPGSKGRK